MQQRTPAENQLRCLQGLQLLFQQAPYDKNKNAGVAAMRGKMEIYNEGVDDPVNFLTEIVKIAKQHVGAKLKDTMSLFGDKADELRKAKDLINLVSEINVNNPQHFVDPTVRIGLGVYHVHKQDELVLVIRAKPRSSSDKDRAEVSPRSQPPLKRQGSRDVGLFAVSSKQYAEMCYDLIKVMKAASKKGIYAEREDLDKFNATMYAVIKQLAEASRKKQSVKSDASLVEAAKNFLDTYYMTYVAGRQKKEPYEFRQAFSDVASLLGSRSKDVSQNDLEKVQDSCEKVYHGFIRTNEELTKAKVQENRGQHLKK